MFRQRGFTLLELCIMLSIGGLIMAASLPSLANVANHQRLHGATMEFVEACRLAQSKAISHGKRYEIRCKPVHNMYEVWTKDWDGGVPKDVMVSQHALDRRLRIQNPNFSGMSKFFFDPEGWASATGSVEFVEVKSRNRNKLTVGVLAGTGKVTVK